MSDEKFYLGPFGLPVKIIISADKQYLDFFKERYNNVELVNDRVEVIWEHRRHDTRSGDVDLTILMELGVYLRDIPREAWTVNWSKSKLP